MVLKPTCHRPPDAFKIAMTAWFHCLGADWEPAAAWTVMVMVVSGSDVGEAPRTGPPGENGDRGVWPDLDRSGPGDDGRGDGGQASASVTRGEGPAGAS